jgi:biotin carboxyl carrier protein
MNIKVKIENQTFEVNVGDLNTRPILATVDGQTFEVWPEEMPRTVVAPVAVTAAPVPSPVSIPTQTPAPKAPATNTPGGTSSIINAPIPGVIVVVAVKEGDSVKKGQELVVLEAMKMKNSIRSNRVSMVGAVKVKVGDHVQHGQALIEYKD